MDPTPDVVMFQNKKKNERREEGDRD